MLLYIAMSWNGSRGVAVGPAPLGHSFWWLADNAVLSMHLAQTNLYHAMGQNPARYAEL